MNDPDEWGEPLPVKPRSERRRRAVMLSFRVGAQELASIEWAAQARGLTISAYLRQSALRGAYLVTEPGPSLTVLGSETTG
jgi:hypothetical protein